MADSSILVKSPDGWKIKVAFGIFGLAVIVVLAFLYRVEVGIITLAIGLGVGARVGVWAWHQYNLADHQRNLANIERRRLEAEVKKAEYAADRERLMRHFLEFNTGVIHVRHPDEIVEVEKFYPAVQASRPLGGDVPAMLPEPRLRRLLDVDFIHLLIVGPSGSGKTTALCWLIENAPPNALVFVLDPHAQFSGWPGRVNEVVGIGRDYEAINIKLASLIAQMDRRYNGLEPVTQKILIVADEWLIIRDKCSNAERFFTEVGSEARKVAMSLVISSISSVLDDLAVSGAIRDNFAQVALNRALRDKNQGELIWSRKDKELVELPGVYRAVFALRQAQNATPARAITEPMPVQEIQEAIEPVPELDAGPVAPLPTADELRICELWDGGVRSLRAIHAAMSDATFGGKYADRIKEVLRRFGRIE